MYTILASFITNIYFKPKTSGLYSLRDNMKSISGILILIKIRVNSFGKPDILRTLSVRYFTPAKETLGHFMRGEARSGHGI